MAMVRITMVIALACASACASDDEGTQPTGGAGGSTGGAGGAGAAGAQSGGTGAAGSGGSTGSSGGSGAGGNAGVMSGGDGGAGGAGGDGASMDASTGGSDSSAPEPDAGASWMTRELSPGPSYMGSGSGGCATSYASVGHAPVDPGSGKHPLFLYFVGTSFSDADQSSQYTSPAALAVTEAMARRGFVALSVDYDNSFSLDLNKAVCLFDQAKSASMLSIACALPEVDCELGIATWGHSQGAALAHGASNFDDRVRAVWTTGYGGGSNALSDTRLRVVNGENDMMNGTLAALNEAAGLTTAECPDDGRSECLRADGSGWIVVREAACEVTSGDHCWFDKANCLANAVTLEPAWVDKDSSAPFALEANADWVAETVARP